MGFGRQIKHSTWLRFALLSLALFLSACAQNNGEDSSAASGSGATAVIPEPAYCATTSSYSPAVTITGNAQFYYRPLSLTLGLYGAPVAAPIRFAEVSVTNSSGSTVQCGHLDTNGNFSVNLPTTLDTYTLTVRARANNNQVIISVLKDITGNEPYAITKSFSLVSADVTAGNKAIGTLNAYARTSESANIEGAAFNIYNCILLANEYLRAQVSGFTVAPKVTVYWKAGFNPYSYFSSSNSLLSFYRNGESKLYILGGTSGSVKSVDTDHFDNSVILHEYGHFLEDIYGKSDSPGGSHSGNAIIDARLAWGEGWSNFIQGAILKGTSFQPNSGLYIDTIGFSGDSGDSGGSGYIAIKFNLTESGTSATYDRVTTSGEGTFREVSVARTLYKTISPVSAVNPIGAGIPFSSLWNVFAGATGGFHDTNTVFFRNIGLFNQLLYANFNGTQQTNWSVIASDEKQNNSTKNYADSTSLSGSCASYPKSLSPVVDVSNKSSQFLSNHFYRFDYDGSANTSLTLSYSQSGTKTIDLDLVVFCDAAKCPQSTQASSVYIYHDDATINSGTATPNIAVQSRRLNAAETPSAGNETVSFNGLAAGTYLINVKAYTYQKTSSDLNGTANYNLQKYVNGTLAGYLCPNH